MTIRHTLLSATLLAAACSPSAFVPLPGSDAGTMSDGAVDRLTPIDAVDATADTGAVDVTIPNDVPTAVDVTSPLDVAPAIDVVDVPVAIDTPPTVDVSDVPSVADAGTCPSGMVLIPGGTFTMGDTDPMSEYAQPPHSVTLSSYCMDVAEVTVAAYSACSATGCSVPGTGQGCNWGIAGRGNHPINCVDWNQARSYCQSRGSDLPTEAQWEYGARGTDGRRYPWGNDAPSSQLCWSGSGIRASTCPVQSLPAGNSPFGLFDMAGNVWEWTLDWHAAYSGAAVTNPTGPGSGSQRVARGCAYDCTGEWVVRGAYRARLGPTERHYFRGFRCARAPL